MDKSISPDGFRPMIQISINKDGKKKLEVAPVAKEVLVGLLTETLALIKATPNNVVNVPRGLSAGGVRNFINRHKKSKQGAFGN